MGKDIKISVIIPVYNTVDYLEEALLSITKQTLKEIEIITIDDGSTDDGLDLLKKMASEDDRIVVLSQENKGQSTTRNRGIEMAKGEYIYFMDADDILDTLALEECYNRCKRDSLDFVLFNIISFPDNTFYPLRHLDSYENIIFKGSDLLKDFIKINQFIVQPCTYLIKKSYLNSIKLRFYPGIIHEDNLFSFFLYIQAERVGYINKDFFRRRFRANSTMTTQMGLRNVIGYITTFEELKKYNWESKDYLDIANLFITVQLNAVLYASHVMSFANKLKIFRYALSSGFFFKIKIRNILVLFLKKHKVYDK